MANDTEVIERAAVKENEGQEEESTKPASIEDRIKEMKLRLEKQKAEHAEKFASDEDLAEEAALMVRGNQRLNESFKSTDDDMKTSRERINYDAGKKKQGIAQLVLKQKRLLEDCAASHAEAEKLLTGDSTMRLEVEAILEDIAVQKKDINDEIIRLEGLYPGLEEAKQAEHGFVDGMRSEQAAAAEKPYESAVAAIITANQEYGAKAIDYKGLAPEEYAQRLVERAEAINAEKDYSEKIQKYISRTDPFNIDTPVEKLADRFSKINKAVETTVDPLSKREIIIAAEARHSKSGQEMIGQIKTAAKQQAALEHLKGFPDRFHKMTEIYEKVKASSEETQTALLAKISDPEKVESLMRHDKKALESMAESVNDRTMAQINEAIAIDNPSNVRRGNGIDGFTFNQYNSLLTGWTAKLAAYDKSQTAALKMISTASADSPAMDIARLSKKFAEQANLWWQQNNTYFQDKFDDRDYPLLTRSSGIQDMDQKLQQQIQQAEKQMKAIVEKVALAYDLGTAEADYKGMGNSHKLAQAKEAIKQIDQNAKRAKDAYLKVHQLLWMFAEDKSYAIVNGRPNITEALREEWSTVNTERNDLWQKELPKLKDDIKLKEKAKQEQDEKGAKFLGKLSNLVGGDKTDYAAEIQSLKKQLQQKEELYNKKCNRYIEIEGLVKNLNLRDNKYYYDDWARVPGAKEAKNIADYLKVLQNHQVEMEKVKPTPEDLEIVRYYDALLERYDAAVRRYKDEFKRHNSHDPYFVFSEDTDRIVQRIEK